MLIKDPLTRKIALYIICVFLFVALFFLANMLLDKPIDQDAVARRQQDYRDATTICMARERELNVRYTSEQLQECVQEQLQNN